AGKVAVQAIATAVSLTKQLLYLPGGCGGAKRSHCVTDAVLTQRHHVHIALDDDHALRIPDGTPCLKQPVKFAALFEERRLRRIKVFWFALVDYPSPESYY